jgi:hypothetical protein
MKENLIGILIFCSMLIVGSIAEYLRYKGIL